MVDRNLIADLQIDEEAASSMIAEALGQSVADGDLEELLAGKFQELKAGTILNGKIIGRAGDDFLVEIGLKSEGILEKLEFDDPSSVEIGDTIEVYLEDIEGETGTVQISKRRADRIRGWENIVATKKEGDAEFLVINDVPIQVVQEF